jgi:hypothetical protein
MIVLMILILVGGIVAVKYLAPRSPGHGQDIVIVMINAAGEEGLDEKLLESDSTVLRKMGSRAISFRKCVAPSPWYPSAAASFMTGLYPSEHGLSSACAHLSMRAMTLAEEFSSVGYFTCAFVDEYSLLASTGVLQGFEHLIQDSGLSLVKIALSHIALHIGKSSFLGLIEVDASACGGAAGVEKVLELIYNRLDKRGFFKQGMMVVSAPGSGMPEDWREQKYTQADEYLMIVGNHLGVASGKVMLKPTSLVDVAGILKRTAWASEFPMRDSVRDGRIVLTERAIPLDAVPEKNPATAPPYFCRLAWFDDLPFHCFVSPDGSFEYQDDTKQRVAVSNVQDELVRARFDSFMLSRMVVENLNIPQAAGPVLDIELAERLGGPWLRKIFLGRRLHAVEHFRLGEAKCLAGYCSRATIDFRSALAIDPDFAEASFRLAKAHATFGRPRAAPYFRSYLEKFADQPGQEENVAEALKFLEGN